MTVMHSRSLLAEHGEYAAAKADVDTLSGRGFPLEHLTIVGTDLYLAEWNGAARGRLRLISHGAAQAALTGVLVGVALALFADAGAAAVLLGCALGAVLGAVSAAAGSLRAQRHGCASCHVVVGRHHVLVSQGWADDARLLLDRKTLPIQSSAYPERDIRMKTHSQPQRSAHGDRA